MKLRRIAAATVIAVGGTLFGGPPAPAAAAVSGADIHYYSTTVSGSFGQHLNATVMCPAGENVVSLGASGGATINSLRPTPNFDGATVVAVLVYATSVKVIAGCVPAPSVANVTRIELRIHDTTPGFRDGIQRCPAGMYGFGGGGGFSSGDSNGMSANLVTADGTGWEYAGDAVNRFDSTQVDVQCAPDDGSTFLVSGGVAGDGQFHVADAVCPSPYFVLSGGAYIANPDGSPSDSGFITESEITHGYDWVWQVDGVAPPGGKVVAVARCTL